MQQWEYKITDIVPKKLLIELNKLGMMGWELIKLKEAEYNNYKAILKRPKKYE